MTEIEKPVRPWPTIEQVRQHYKARALADQKIGARLSDALRKPDISDATRDDILFWMEFHPDCRF